MWKNTAKKLFTHVKEDDVVKRKGLYDKVIIDCAFREDLGNKKSPDPHGGCNGFQPSLTTNGMCYTFNGKNVIDLWKSSEVITTFDNLFQENSKNNKTFGGSRSVQGKHSVNQFVPLLH